MKIQTAIELRNSLTIGIENALRNGDVNVQLFEQATNMDDKARQELADAIDEAEK